MEELKTLTFDTSVSSMEYVADGEIVVITYGKTIAFYNALRCNTLSDRLCKPKLIQCVKTHLVQNISYSHDLMIIIKLFCNGSTSLRLDRRHLNGNHYICINIIKMAVMRTLGLYGVHL